MCGWRGRCAHSLCRPPRHRCPPLLLQAPPRALRRAQLQLVRAEGDGAPSEAVEDDLDLSESARKKAEADRLRKAEKFMVVGTGEAQCKACGYEYSPKRGDPDYPVSPGTKFQVGAGAGACAAGAGAGTGAGAGACAGASVGGVGGWRRVCACLPACVPACLLWPACAWVSACASLHP